MALHTVKLYNENDKVSGKVRAKIKEVAVAKLHEVLAEGFNREVITGTDGATYVPIYLTEKDETIYLRLEATASLKDPLAAKTTEKVVKEVEVVEIPEL